MPVVTVSGIRVTVQQAAGDRRRPHPNFPVAPRVTLTLIAETQVQRVCKFSATSAPAPVKRAAVRAAPNRVLTVSATAIANVDRRVTHRSVLTVSRDQCVHMSPLALPVATRLPAIHIVSAPIKLPIQQVNTSRITQTTRGRTVRMARVASIPARGGCWDQMVRIVTSRMLRFAQHARVLLRIVLRRHTHQRTARPTRSNQMAILFYNGTKASQLSMGMPVNLKQGAVSPLLTWKFIRRAPVVPTLKPIACITRN